MPIILRWWLRMHYSSGSQSVLPSQQHPLVLAYPAYLSKTLLVGPSSLWIDRLSKGFQYSLKFENLCIEEILWELATSVN